MGIFLKSEITFFVLLFFTRALGKKQMNQITYFDYITGITLGSIAASVSVDRSINVADGVVSFVTWAGLAFLISLVTMKSYRARNFLDGEPEIIIKNGRIMREAIKKSHLNMDDVMMLLREKDVFSVSEVDYAILEPHGKLSVLKKAEMGGVTKKDMNIAATRRYLPTDIIIDGKIIKRNLSEIGLDELWVSTELLKRGVSGVKKVLYMALLEDGEAYVSLKN